MYFGIFDIKIIKIQKHVQIFGENLAVFWRNLRALCHQFSINFFGENKCCHFVTLNNFVVTLINILHWNIIAFYLLSAYFNSLVSFNRFLEHDWEKFPVCTGLCIKFPLQSGLINSWLTKFNWRIFYWHALDKRALSRKPLWLNTYFFSASIYLENLCSISLLITDIS